MSARRTERKVLLAIREGHVDQRLLSSARALCQRMDAAMDILVRCAGEKLPAMVEAFVHTLQNEGVSHSLIRQPRLRRRDVVNYANTHECIATVVIDSLEGWESVAEDRSANPWRNLPCPLVTAVATKSAATA